MRFNLIDRIVEVCPGKSLRAIKNLTLGEEYLADHFPSFPVMPGVLMLQTLVEAGAWLLRLTDDFAHSVVVLREVRNIKYGTFMEPGKQLSVGVELIERGDGRATFKGKGETEGQPTVSARVTLAFYNLRDREEGMKASDERIVRHLRERAAWLLGSHGTEVRGQKSKVRDN
jgi:3-hydroxyacyl-[acyl-carrier-protein] dehydratase